MLPLLVLLFLAVPVVEIWLVVQVGDLLGWWSTAGLLLLDAVAGAYLVRRELRRAVGEVSTALRSGQLPARQTGDALVVAVGGAFLLAPGFLTDAVGLVCVLPRTRPLARRLLWSLVLRRIPGGALLAATRRGRTRVRVVDAEPVEPVAGPRR